VDAAAPAWPSPSPPVGGPDGSLRIGDRERQLVADELRTHFTAGRIDVDEFSSRLDEVWAATTATDLWVALRQLPPVPGQTRPWDVPAPGRPVRPGDVASAGWSGRPAGWSGPPGWSGRPAGWSGPPGWSGRPAWSADGPPPRPSVPHALARAHLRTYLTVAAVLVAVWLLTTPGGYFWPAWPLLFWGWFVFLHHRTTRRWEDRRARRA